MKIFFVTLCLICSSLLEAETLYIPPEAILGPSDPELLTPKKKQIRNQANAPAHIFLDDVLQEAISCNWGLWISQAQQLQQQGIWREARGAFDPQVAGEFNRQWREDAQEIPFKSRGDGRRSDWNVGLNKRFPAGTEISASLLHFNEFDPTEFGAQRNSNQYTWQVTLRQPILQDYLCGSLHTSVQAEWRRYLAASWQFVHDAATTLLSVSQGYWQLYFRQQIVQIRQDTIAELERLENATERLVEMDRIPSTQLFQQRAEIGNERRSLCEARQSEADAWHQLLVLTGSDPACSCDQNIPIIANRPDAIKLPEHDCEQSVWMGLSMRADLKAAALRTGASEQDLAGAENAILPQLDLIASLGQVNHEVGRNARPFFSSFGAEAPEQNYLVGVSFSYPLWNQTARGRRLQACSQLKRQKAQAELLAAQIAGDIRSSVAEMYNRQCQLDAAREAVKWFQDAKEAEIKRWQAGYSTLFVVIDFIRREANAKISLAIAEATYGNAYLEYLFQTGTWVTSDPSFCTLEVAVIGGHSTQCYSN